MTLDEIRELDAGYGFEDTSGQFPFRGQGITVPTFEEVLLKLPSARLNVEMKDFSPDRAADLCRLLEENGATDRVLAASFDHDAMLAFRESCPPVATSATFRDGMIFYQLSRVHLESLYRGPAAALQTPQYLRGQQVLDPGLLEIAEVVNLQVQVFTVNEESVMKRLLDMGVQGIITDYPDRLLRVMGRAPGAVDKPNADW
jgi:glycerophosphoryl diester phosphodiesterase